MPVQSQQMQTAVSQPDKNVCQQTASQPEITASQQITQPQPEKAEPQKSAAAQPERIDQQLILSSTEKTTVRQTQPLNSEKPINKEEQSLLEYGSEKPEVGSEGQQSSAILQEPREDSRE